MDKVAVFCAVRNRPEMTKQTLDTLYKTGIDFDLFLCDDASTDGTDEMIRNWKPPREGTVVKKFNEKNLGITPTKQILVNVMGDYDYYYMTDNDYWYGEGWLEELIRVYKKHPDLAVLGCTTYPTHKIKFVENDVILREIQTGGTMLMDKYIFGMFKDKWVPDWEISEKTQDSGSEVGHLANPYYGLHCGITMVSGKLNEKQTIQGKKHHVADAYIKTLCKQVGAIYG